MNPALSYCKGDYTVNIMILFYINNKINAKGERAG